LRIFQPVRPIPAVSLCNAALEQFQEKCAAVFRLELHKRKKLAGPLVATFPVEPSAMRR